MTEDIAQVGLKDAPVVDWENYNKGSNYLPPPVPIKADGKAVIFFGVATATETDPDDGYLQFLLDPIKIVKTDNGAITGQNEVRFVRASVKPYMKADKDGNKVPKKGNPNKLADYLRGCGLQAKPQQNSEYRAAVRACSGKLAGFVGDWEAYSKETGESIRGYLNFPDDPERPGQKKSILKAGDFYTVSDNKGNVIETKQVQAEVLFANLRLRYFVDPSRVGK